MSNLKQVQKTNTPVQHASSKKLAGMLKLSEMVPTKQPLHKETGGTVKDHSGDDAASQATSFFTNSEVTDLEAAIKGNALRDDGAAAAADDQEASRATESSFNREEGFLKQGKVVEDLAAIGQMVEYDRGNNMGDWNYVMAMRKFMRTVEEEQQELEAGTLTKDKLEEAASGGNSGLRTTKLEMHAVGMYDTIVKTTVEVEKRMSANVTSTNEPGNTVLFEYTPEIAEMLTNKVHMGLVWLLGAPDLVVFCVADGQHPLGQIRATLQVVGQKAEPLSLPMKSGRINIAIVKMLRSTGKLLEFKNPDGTYRSDSINILIDNMMMDRKHAQEVSEKYKLKEKPQAASAVREAFKLEEPQAPALAVN